MFLFLINSITLSFTLIFILLILSPQNSKTSNISSPFESGFNMMKMPQKMFSIRYFSICLLFLIFDMEITLFIPFLIMKINNIKMLIMMMSLILILSQGLIEEWNKMILKWI